MRLPIIILLAASALALTPAERALVKHANEGIAAGIVANQELSSDLAQARDEAAQSDVSAALAGARAAEAEKQANAQHDELKRAATENAEMRPIVAEVQSYWGIGGIIYGFKRLAVHVLILIAVLLVAAIAIAVFAPWLFTGIRLGMSGAVTFLGGIEAVMGPLWKRLWSDFTGLFQRKAPNDKKKSSKRRR